MADQKDGKDVKDQPLIPIPDVEPRRFYVDQYPSCSMLDLLLVITRERRTGSLTVNFSQGIPSGNCEWKARGNGD